MKSLYLNLVVCYAHLMDFSYDMEETEKTIRVVLRGYLDEFATLPPIGEFRPYEEAVLDFGLVDFINSGGIKLWLIFAHQLEELTDLSIKLVNCKRFVIDQISIIEGFLPNKAKVESVLIPIFCQKCEDCFDVSQKIETLDQDLPNILDKAIPINCDKFPECKKFFELDIDPERYSGF